MHPTIPLPPGRLPGFRVVPQRQLGDVFDPSQCAFYVLLGRHGPPDDLRERVWLVHCVDHFLLHCQAQIEELWNRHRVRITHVAVKLTRRHPPRDFSDAYARALAMQRLRQRLQPRFRRL